MRSPVSVHHLVARVAARWVEQIPGGLAKGKKPKDFDQTALAKGQKVEMEHTGDPNMAQEITMDHLTEDPNYYDKLELMERQAGTNQEVIEAPHNFHPVEVQPPKAKRKKFPFQGYIDFQGLEIDVENEKGSTREGESSDGTKWSTEMFYHYGEIRGTEGVDGDKLDAYVGDNHDSSVVVAIHQHDPKTGKFDEDKVMLGFDSVEEAIGAYKKQYDKPGFYQEDDHLAMPIGQFWRWVHGEKNRGRKVKEAEARFAHEEDRDLDRLYEEYRKLAPEHGYNIFELGDVDRDPLLLLTPKEVPPGNRQVLVLAGVHGDEPGGVFAARKFFENPNCVPGVSVSIIPVVNPHGFRRNERVGLDGRDPNREMFPGQKHTFEGEILQPHIKRLAEVGQDGVCSVHEDWEAREFFVYDDPRFSVPSLVARRLCQEAAHHFHLADEPSGTRSYDTSIEGWLAKADLRIYTLELPGVCDLQRRKDCGAALIRVFGETIREGWEKIGPVGRVVARHRQAAFSKCRWRDLPPEEQGKPHPECPMPDYVEGRVRQTCLGELGRFRVWVVDGNAVRNLVDIDFTQGGNPAVYGYIPKDELWVESKPSLEDTAFTILHEAIETVLMLDAGDTYEQGHDHASKVENLYRAYSGGFPNMQTAFDWAKGRFEKWQAGRVASSEPLRRKLANPALLHGYPTRLQELREAVQHSKSLNLGNTSTLWVAWHLFYKVGQEWAAYVIDHLAFPPKVAKAVEMAARLFSRSYGWGKGPSDIIKWFENNEARLVLLDQARAWPERSEESGVFKQGPFIVHNTVQAIGPALDLALDIIDRATRAVSGSGVPGFAQMSYGTLFLVGQIKRKNWAAWYVPSKDVIYLRPRISGISVEESARHLVHELGHRFWAKKLDRAIKSKWVSHHTSLVYGHVDTKLPEVGDVLPLQVNKKTVRVEQYEQPSGKATLVDVTTNQPIGSVGLAQLMGWVQEVAKRGKFPTPYSASDPEEHFCEALSLYAINKLTGPNLEAFNEIMLGVNAATVARVAARYQEKKEVPKAEGKGTTTVYEYSDRQVALRNHDKAERVEKLRGKIGDLREKYRKDLTAKDEQTRNTALAVALIDETFERVGNMESAADGHFGVTGWKVKHITFKDGKAVVKYVGKSGVKQEKVVESKPVLKALKDAVRGKGDEDLVCEGEDCEVTSVEVNAYLEPFDVTAKDLRGFHANSEMQKRLKAIRSKGGALPKNPKEKKEKLKTEFQEALDATAEAVGHEASTLKSQYLVPGLEEEFLKDGEVSKKLDKRGSIYARVANRWVVAVDEKTKYPRTPHVPWSPGFTGDDIRLIDLGHFKGKQVVVTEKLDGENCTIGRNYSHARSLDPQPHPSRDWVKSLAGQIGHDIPDGWRLCGENLFAQHSIAYDELPSYFVLFSIWDNNNVCLSWDDTEEWAQLLGVHTVPVLYRGPWDEEKIQAVFDGKSKFSAGGPAEGYVVRNAGAFHYSQFNKNIAKYVRAGHVAPDSQHWTEMVVKPNKLIKKAATPSFSVLRFLQMAAKGQGKTSTLDIDLLREALGHLGWTVTTGQGARLLDNIGDVLKSLWEPWLKKHQVVVSAWSGMKGPVELWTHSQETTEAAYRDFPLTPGHPPVDPSPGKLYVGKVEPPQPASFWRPERPTWSLNTQLWWMGVPIFNVMARSVSSPEFPLRVDHRGQTEDPHKIQSPAFWTWAYKNGLKEAATEFLASLGQETVESLSRPPSARSLEGTGTCPVCFNNVKMVQGKMMRHGWSVQGQRSRGQYGQTTHTGPCFGAGWEPFEFSPDGTKAFIERGLKPSKARLEQKLRAWQQNPPNEIPGRGKPLVRPEASASYREKESYEAALKTTLSRLEGEIEAHEQDIKDFTQRVASWKEKPLPGQPKVSALNPNQGQWNNRWDLTGGSEETSSPRTVTQVFQEFSPEHFRLTCPRCGNVNKCRCKDHVGDEVLTGEALCRLCTGEDKPLNFSWVDATTGQKHNLRLAAKLDVQRDVLTHNLLPSPYLSDLKMAARIAYRWATKSDAEKEDEEAERLVRPSPKKKPPREDLRRERVEEPDEDTQGAGAENDDDLSLNYKRVAARWIMRLAKKKAPLTKAPVAKKRQPGEVWRSEKGEGWVAKNKDGVVHAFPEEEQAKAYAKGEETPEGKAPTSPGEKPPETSTEPEKAPEEKKGPAAPQAKSIEEFVGSLDKPSFKAMMKEVKDLFGPGGSFGKIKDEQAIQGEDEYRDFRPHLESMGLPPHLFKTFGDVREFIKQVPELAKTVGKPPKKEKKVPEAPAEPSPKAPVAPEPTPAAPASPEPTPAAPEPKTEAPTTEPVKDEEKETAETPEENEARKKRTSDWWSGKDDLDALLDPEAHIKKTDQILKGLGEFLEGGALAALPDTQTVDDPKVAGILQKLKVPKGHFKTVGEVRSFVTSQVLKDSTGTATKEDVQKDLKSRSKDKDKPQVPLEIAKMLEDVSAKELPKDQAGMDRLVSTYKTELKALQAQAKKGYKSLMTDAEKALKSPGSGTTPEGQGRSLALAQFARETLANPSKVGGKDVSDEDKTTQQLQERSQEAFEQFSSAGENILEEAAKQMADQLAATPEDSPKRQELDSILEGLALAASMAEKPVPESLHAPHSNEQIALAKALKAKGKVNMMLEPVERAYSPQGRKVIQEALEEVGDDELNEIMGGEKGVWGPVIKAMADLDPEQKKVIREFLQMMAVDSMATIHAMAVSAYEGKKSAIDAAADRVGKDKRFQDALAKFTDACLSGTKGDPTLDDEVRKTWMDVWMEQLRADGIEPDKTDPVQRQVLDYIKSGDPMVWGREYVREGELETVPSKTARTVAWRHMTRRFLR